MKPLRVTAYLSTPLAVTDDWSPSLDALLIKLLLDERGLATSNPTPDNVAANQPIIDASMPINKGEIGSDWYWQTSSPCYLYDGEQIPVIHRRWDCQEQHMDWHGKRRKWSTSEGHTKGWTVLLPERNTERIDWYCVGDSDEILRLLEFCTGLGKKRRTQVARWFATDIDEDWHLWRNGALMRPVPTQLLQQSPPSILIRRWAWRPPTHMPENMAKCAMPIGLAQKVEAVYGVA